MQKEQSHNSTIVLSNLKTNVIQVLITQGYQAFKINLPLYMYWNYMGSWEWRKSVGLGSISTVSKFFGKRLLNYRSKILC